VKATAKERRNMKPNNLLVFKNWKEELWHFGGDYWGDLQYLRSLKLFSAEQKTSTQKCLIWESSEVSQNLNY